MISEPSMTSLLAEVALSLLHGQIHSCPSPGQLLALLQMPGSWDSFSFPSHFPILIPAELGVTSGLEKELFQAVLLPEHGVKYNGHGITWSIHPAVMAGNEEHHIQLKLQGDIYGRT